MVIPIGVIGAQTLQRIKRTEIGYDIKALEPVSFVPFLTGKE